MATDISALMSSLWYWELAGYATLAAVAVGVAGESVHELTDWFKGFPWWKAKGGAASALVLILALAAELVTQVETSSISGEVIAFLSEQEAETRKRSAELEKQAAALFAQTAEANARAGRARREAEEARERAAAAQLALAKFKAPRSLSIEQQRRIADKLKQFAGTTFDIGIGPKGDPEPLYLARDISSALLLADWKFVPWSGGGETLTEPPMTAIGVTMVTNVIVDVHPDRWAKFGDAAVALAAALGGEDIAAIADSKPTSINTDAIHVRIGRKL